VPEELVVLDRADDGRLFFEIFGEFNSRHFGFSPRTGR
jgi:hypothetical protein